MAEKNARTFLGKLVKEYSEEAVGAAIGVAALKNPVDPKAFIVAFLQERRKRPRDRVAEFDRALEQAERGRERANGPRDRIEESLGAREEQDRQEELDRQSVKKKLSRLEAADQALSEADLYDLGGVNESHEADEPENGSVEPHVGGRHA